MGQSPLHPFGWCIISPHEGCALGVRNCMTPGDGCFTYVVQSAAQALANTDGLCVPSAECDALAAQLPSCPSGSGRGYARWTFREYVLHGK